MANRNLIDYLPQFMQDYLEMQKIMNAEQTEINNLWNAADNVFDDQFILDATENGVSRWETMLDISPKETDTLGERKYRILTKLNQELPYTMKKLQEVLTTLCGADGFSVILTANSYRLEVRLAIGNRKNYSEVESILTKMIPANLTILIQVMYNTHEALSGFSHAQMGSYTHHQLKEEVVS